MEVAFPVIVFTQPLVRIAAGSGAADLHGPMVWDSGEDWELALSLAIGEMHWLGSQFSGTPLPPRKAARLPHSAGQAVYTQTLGLPRNCTRPPTRFDGIDFVTISTPIPEGPFRFRCRS